MVSLKQIADAVGVSKTTAERARAALGIAPDGVDDAKGTLFFTPDHAIAIGKRAARGRWNEGMGDAITAVMQHHTAKVMSSPAENEAPHTTADRHTATSVNGEEEAAHLREEADRLRAELEEARRLISDLRQDKEDLRQTVKSYQAIIAGKLLEAHTTPQEAAGERERPAASNITPEDITAQTAPTAADEAPPKSRKWLGIFTRRK